MELTMPKPPHVASPFLSLSGSVFTKYAKEIAEIEGKIYPFHIGDSFMEPAVKMEDLSVLETPGMHRYTSPQGFPPLLGALEKKHQIDRDKILVSAGATGGLHILAMSLIDPGDEVLILAPYWPLIAGIVKASRGVPVSVPFFGEEKNVQQLLTPFLTDKTVAVYVNSPNNPTGVVLDRECLTEIAGFAKANGLWIWTDEVYASLSYTKEHIELNQIAPERTFSVHSFSKVYGMAGNRCGYILCPSKEAMVTLQKATTYAYYSVSTASQLAATKVLEEGEEWLQFAHQAYYQAGIEAADALGVPRPEGGTFLFLDLREKLSAAGHTADDFLLRCIDHNMLLAPGASFGHQYDSFVRICFTAAPKDEVMEGISVLQKIIDEY